MTQEREEEGLAELAEERYLEALERHGLEDLRPVCRAMLRELKDGDERSYHQGVRRYQEELQPAVAGGEADPVAAWIDYGAWLADRLRPGRTVAVDPDGRARPLEDLEAEGSETTGTADSGDGGDDPPPFPTRHLVLHLPEEWSDGGRIISVPAEPTEYQEATRELFEG
jgi:hypothetical protein